MKILVFGHKAEKSAGELMGLVYKTLQRTHYYTRLKEENDLCKEHVRSSQISRAHVQAMYAL